MAGLSLSYGKRMKQRTPQEDVKFWINVVLIQMGSLSNIISSKEFVHLFKSGLPYYMELGIFGLVPEKKSSATAAVNH